MILKMTPGKLPNLQLLRLYRNDVLPLNCEYAGIGGVLRCADLLFLTCLLRTMHLVAADDDQCATCVTAVVLTPVACAVRPPACSATTGEG